MKKLMVLLAVALMLSLAAPVWAEGFTDMLDGVEVEVGNAYDFKGEALLTTTTISPIKWKYKDTEKASIGGGVATDFDDYTYPIAIASYIPGGLEKYGFSYPFKDIFKPELFAFIGKEFNTPEKEWHWGGGIKLIQTNF